MLKRFFERFRTGQAPEDALYDSIVAAARQARLYADWGVPDTPAGRIEMVAVHTAIVTHALIALGAAGEERARALNERFVTDMDDNMREIGVGDLTVPRKVKKAAAAVYDRVALVEKISALGAAQEKVDAAMALAEIEDQAEGLDRHALGVYFSHLINELSGHERQRLLAIDAKMPMLANDVGAL